MGGGLALLLGASLRRQASILRRLDSHASSAGERPSRDRPGQTLLPGRILPSRLPPRLPYASPAEIAAASPSALSCERPMCARWRPAMTSAIITPSTAWATAPPMKRTPE